MFVKPADRIYGEVFVPGDKSISHRAAIFAAISDGTSTISNFLVAEDCLSTLRCIEQLGSAATRDGTTVKIDGCGIDGLAAPTTYLDCGNSGTTARTLAGVLAGQPFRSTLIGDESLSKRPMRRVIEPLERLGASIESRDGKLPLTLGNESLTGREIEMTVASAQVKTCILLAGLNARGETAVIEPTQTRDHTERMLEWYGVDVSSRPVVNGRRIAVRGGSRLTARDIIVPGDISSAAFLIVAAACTSSSSVTIRNVGVNPTRTGILEVLQRCGVKLDVLNAAEVCNEPTADLAVSAGELRTPPRLEGSTIANVIDELPILAVLGTQLPDGIEVRGASELRVKESDRIDAIVKNLRSIGAEVDEFEDGFRVSRSDIIGGEVDSFGDHRIAMAFAIAGLLSRDGVDIDHSDCTEISFPGFFETLRSLVN